MDIDAGHDGPSSVLRAVTVCIYVLYNLSIRPFALTAPPTVTVCVVRGDVWCRRARWSFVRLFCYGCVDAASGGAQLPARFVDGGGVLRTAVSRIYTNKLSTGHNR